MQEVKIQNFKKEHLRQFPRYVSLSGEECEVIQFQLKENLLIPKDHDLMSWQLEHETFVESFNAEEDGFDLYELLTVLNIKFLDFLYINWYRYDQIDELGSMDVIKYFDDLWYPAADDIDIFDNNFNWIVAIRHDGQVYILRPKLKKVK